MNAYELLAYAWVLPVLLGLKLLEMVNPEKQQALGGPETQDN